MQPKQDNYDVAREKARLYFLNRMEHRPPCLKSVETQGGCYRFPFLGAMTRVDSGTGEVTFSWPWGPDWEADYSEALSVYDWLCDRKPDATSSGEFCPVGSLPGVYVGGGGLSMSGGSFSEKIDKAPDRFRAACVSLGGAELPLGDLGFRLNVFPDLPMVLKFYHGDEDFPPSLTLLWDKNTLRFVRYETVYYIAGCLLDRLSLRMEMIPRNGTL